MIDLKAERRKHAFKAIKAKKAGDLERADFFYGLVKTCGAVQMYFGSADPKFKKAREETMRQKRDLFKKYGVKLIEITLDI